MIRLTPLLFLISFIFSLPSLHAQLYYSFKVQLHTVGGQIDDSRYRHIQDLGVLLIEVVPGKKDFKTVSLGRYLDKETAEEIVDSVKNRGFSRAMVVGIPLYNPMQAPKYHGLQFFATKKLNIQKLRTYAQWPNALYDQLYIWKYKGVYRLFLGLIPSDQEAQMQEYERVAQKMGFDKSFWRYFEAGQQIKSPTIISPVQRNKEQLPTTGPGNPSTSSVELRPVRKSKEEKE